MTTTLKTLEQQLAILGTTVRTYHEETTQQIGNLRSEINVLRDCWIQDRDRLARYNGHLARQEKEEQDRKSKRKVIGDRLWEIVRTAAIVALTIIITNLLSGA